MRAILTYHSIDESGSPISIAPEAFRRHVRWLASGRVRVTTLEELVRLPAESDAIALTFDDGFDTFATVAAPVLADHGLPATLFVVADRAGSTNAWSGRDAPGIPTLSLMSWQAIARCAERGIRIGGHGRTHRPLAGLTVAALEDEIAGSRERITTETGIVPAVFAYPYGSHDARTVAVTARHFALACTTELRPLRAAEGGHALPRLDAYYFRSPGRLERWGSVAFRHHLWLRARARWARQRAITLLSPA